MKRASWRRSGGRFAAAILLAEQHILHEALRMTRDRRSAALWLGITGAQLTALIARHGYPDEARERRRQHQLRLRARRRAADLAHWRPGEAA